MAKKMVHLRTSISWDPEDLPLIQELIIAISTARKNLSLYRGRRTFGGYSYGHKNQL